MIEINNVQNSENNELTKIIKVSLQNERWNPL